MKNITTIIALLFTSVVYAQDTLKLSLPDALKYSLSNNKTIQAGALDEALNGYKLKELKTAIYPSVNGNANITHYINAPKQFIPANTFNPSAPSDQYTGAKFQLPNISDVGLSASWVIYNKAITSAIKLLKGGNELTTIQLQKDKSELAFSISQLYYGIIFAQKQKETLYKIDTNFNKLINILQSNYQNGLIRKSDIDKVKINKSNLNSQIEQLSSAIKTQGNLLKFLMGLPATTYAQLIESNIENSLNPIVEPSSDAENSFDLKLVQAQIKLSKIERESIKASYYPTVGIIYNYSYNWVNTNFGKLFGSSLNFPQQFIGVNLSVPIFDGKKYSIRLKSNSVSTKQLSLKAQYLSDKVNTEITNAQLVYNSSLININSNNLNIKLAERLYAQSILEYQQGTIPLNDVLAIETSLEQAQSEYFHSVSNALIALLEYKKATNTILTK